MRARRLAIAVAAVLALTVACSGDDAGDRPTGVGGSGSGATTGTTAALPAGYAGYESKVYADDDNWLCKPGKDGDLCLDEDLDATAVHPDGSMEVQPHEVAEDPAVDCFYVYPTVSRDAGPSADMKPGEGEEVWVVRNQAARFTSSCRVFAPIYRQVTLSAIGGGGGGGGGRAAAARTAYADVVDAFKQYVANYSDGRGFVLIGHSQGSGLLTRLIADEIDNQPALRSRMVSAILAGTNLPVPEGKAMGGAFKHVPLCQADDETGCVVAYASYRASQPPGPGAIFGRVQAPGQMAACVNPAAVGGGKGTLIPYFPLGVPAGALGGSGARRGSPFKDVARVSQIETPWFTMPDFVEAQCVQRAGFSYLALSVDAVPSDPRGDDIGGDLTPEWGMHLIDVNVAEGNLVDLVASEGKAYRSG
jgi:hypothetical protein